VPGPDVSANGLVTLSKQSDPAVRTEPFLAARTPSGYVHRRQDRSFPRLGWLCLRHSGLWTVDSVARALGSGHLFSPRRPTLMGPKWAKPQAPVGSACGNSFVLTLIRRSLQRVIHGPVQLNRHPCRLPPGSASELSLHFASRLFAKVYPDAQKRRLSLDSRLWFASAVRYFGSLKAIT